MIVGPAERLVKHSSLQAWGEGRMVSVSPGSKFASHPNMAPRSRTGSGMTLDGSICRFVPSRSVSVPLVTCGFVLGS